MKTAHLEKVISSPGFMILAGGVVVWLLWDKLTGTVKAAGETVGGAISGNNAITAGTVYQGGGVAGTLGAATNAASGGLFEKWGTWIGGTVYDLTHPDTTSRTQLTADNYRSIDPNFYEVPPP